MLLPAVGVGAAGYGGVRRGMGIHISCKIEIAICSMQTAEIQFDQVFQGSKCAVSRTNQCLDH